MKRQIQNLFNQNKGFLLFLVLMMTVRWSFADQYHVPTGSMESTILVGDRIFVSKAAYDLRFPFTEWRVAHLAEPQHGDIVVFDSVEGDGLTLVKRVVGLPGDQIHLEDGVAWVNGEKEASLPHLQRLADGPSGENVDFRVPEGAYFVMGDNRDNSRDSRFFGFVPRGHLKGRALRVLWSLQNDSEGVRLRSERFGRGLVH